MIVVVVGTHFRGFERMVKWMDRIAGQTDEDVVMQIGSTRYEPRNSTFFRYAPYPEMKALISRARVVVCHAGSGSVLDSLQSGKVPVVVPRLPNLGEVRDMHQVEFAKILVREGRAVGALDENELRRAVLETPADIPSFSDNPTLVLAIKRYIGKVGEKKG